MDISIWGPSLWELLHSVAFGYNLTPVTSMKKKQYILFFSSIEHLIPCYKCKTHYKYYLNSNSILHAVNSYNGIIKWVNNLHNTVNAKIGKKKQTLETSKIKYVNKNGSLNVIYDKIYIFIDNAVQNTTHIDFKNIKIFLNSLYHIFPSEKCRLQLNIFDRTNRLNKINIRNIKKWYSKLNIRSLER
jgi:hypothetical protein